MLLQDSSLSLSSSRLVQLMLSSLTYSGRERTSGNLTGPPEVGGPPLEDHREDPMPRRVVGVLLLLVELMMLL